MAVSIRQWFITGFTLFNLFLFHQAVFAQYVPQHTRLLYSNDLQNPGGDDNASVVNRDGQFIAGKGWEISNRTSQLVITLNKALPYEGTLEIKITNLDPVNQVTDEWIPFSFWSRQQGDFYQVDSTLGSYAFLKTDIKRLDTANNTAGIDFFSASYQGNQNLYNPDAENREKTKYAANGEWDPRHTYTFKFIWNTEYMWLYMDGKELARHRFYGQLEKFKYIFLGEDNTYYWAMPGPIFSDLKIYGPEVALNFTDITEMTGTAGYSDHGYGHGVSFADANRDGAIDLFSSNAVRALVVPDMLQINQGDGTFKNEAAARGVTDEGVTHTILNADFDNDGDLDVFYSNMPIDTGSPLGRNALYRNDGNGYYTDITDWAGMTTANNGSRGALAVDIDNDGDLDLYVVNWGEQNELYLNDGQGKFTRIHRGTDGEVEDINILGQQGATAVDFDNDGDMDIYVCRRQEESVHAPNWLFVNDGNGNFTEEAEARGVAFGGRSNGANFADVDNDGDLDLFVVNSKGHSNDQVQLHVAINRGDGTFEDRSDEYNIWLTGYNVLFGDIDNDADLDMYLIRNDVRDESARPEVYLNDGSGHFTKMGYSEARVPTKDPRGAAYADFDGDGDIDFYIACKFSHNFFIRNDIENDNNYLQVLCIGPGGDYGGFGSKVSVYQAGHIGDPNYLLGYQESRATYGYLCQNETALHFGLAQNQFCDVRVRFTSGRVVDKLNVAANTLLTVQGAASTPATLERVASADTTGYAGQVLANALTVRILDDQNSPVSDFPVTFQAQGEGTLNGTSRTQVEIQTDNNGEANAEWHLGTESGQQNKVIVTARNDSGNLTNSPMTFTSFVRAGIDTMITKYAGDNQNGHPETPLQDSLKVLVKDSFDNPHANVAVKFKMRSGGGFLNGLDSIIVHTNKSGFAAAKWTLGPAIGANAQSVSATLVYGDQSLVTFYASAEHGEAARLVYIAGDSTRGVIDQLIPSPLKIKVVDSAGLPVPNHSVTFRSVQGGGHFNGAQTKQAITDSNGIAIAQPTLGHQVGDYNYVFSAEATNNSGQSIENSPFNFYLSARISSATQMINITPSPLSGQAKEFLQQPLKIKVLDSNNQPVPSHNIFFAVVQGTGKLGNNETDTLSIQSDADGIAMVRFRLGDEIGTDVDIVRASSTDGLDDLINSPMDFKISAPYGQPDSLLSTITATDTVIADGVSQATVTISLKDRENNPVPGEQVEITVAGKDVEITQPGQPTDSLGMTSAQVTSTKAELKYVTATVTSGILKITDRATISFIPGPASKLLKTGGDGQTGAINSALRDPVIVKVTDQFENAIRGAQVHFNTSAGDGYVQPAQSIPSDSTGHAIATWILGPEIGTQTLQASTPGVTEPVTFTAEANPPKSTTLVKIKGDEQYASPQTIFADSLIVKVQDPDGNPIAGVTIQFSVESGDVHLSAAQVKSDIYGFSRVQLTAGNLLSGVIVRALLNDTTFVDFNCSVSNSTPDSLYAFYGNGLTAAVGDTVYPLVVSVVDENRKPVANVPVIFSSLTPGGSILDEQPVRTNNNGQALGRVHLGTVAGNYVFSAANSGLKGSPVTFTISAQAAAPAIINIVQGNGQKALPLSVLPNPLQIKVIDQYENPVQGVPLAFDIESGGGKITDPSDTTNSAGLGSCRWQLGLSGAQLVRVSSSAMPGYSQAFSAQLLPNKPPVFDVVTDTSVVEKQTLIFHVGAVDPEKGPVHLSAVNLPQGASFDSVNTGNFFWTPALDQQGTYQVQFSARDINGGLAQQNVHIEVLNFNRPPSITAHQPEQADVTASMYQPLHFNVSTVDLDNDSLFYSWIVNGYKEGQDSLFSVIPNPNLGDEFEVKAIVSDKSASASFRWIVHVQPTVVEISAFTAQAVEDRVSITWETANEAGTAGYNIFRAVDHDGPFTMINKRIITPNKKNSYRYNDAPPQTNTIFYYKLQTITAAGKQQFFDPVRVEMARPKNSQLLQNYPNPFNPETTIKYQLSQPQHVKIQIYNIAGQVIRTLVDGNINAGYHKLIWDGRNDDGMQVTSGVYHCVLRGDKFHAMIKLVLLK